MPSRTWPRILTLISLLAGMVPRAASAAPPPPDPSTNELTHPLTSALISPAQTDALPSAPVVPFGSGPVEEVLNRADPFLDASQFALAAEDPLVQEEAGAGAMPLPLVNFEGQGNRDRLVPPDTDGQVGPDHFVQMVNTSTAVYDKSGRLLYGPFHPGDLWPAGDACNLNNDGDPVVLYDQMADRWILSQFALPNDQMMGPFFECIAVSRGPVPTNRPADWYAYSFPVHATKFNDYPKLAVWPDGYYMSANQFAGTLAAGAGVWAFDRRQMLQGLPATFQYFDLEALNPNLWGLLPGNLLGSTPPPAGAPNYFGAVDQDWAGSQDVFHIFEFHVDWEDPAQSSFRLVRNLPVAEYDALFETSRTSIPQPGTANRLDSIPGRLMMHLWYRNFGEYSVLTANHTVDSDGNDHAGIRWYEIRNPGAGASVFQQGTYAPDSHHRWMGSLAMDRVGNIALGYSIASRGLYPGVRYTGREAGDPPGVMTMSEVTLVNGGASQTLTNRWGDYSAMSLDPLDDCTFWYTQMYIGAGNPDWRTRIGAFRFPGCNASTGSLQGQARKAGGEPLAQVEISAAMEGSDKVYATTSGPDGRYGFSGLPVGRYTVRAELYGYERLEVSGVELAGGERTGLDLELHLAPRVTVSGEVRDGETGWPLYARIEVPGYPVQAAFSDPRTGRYALTLAAGSTYTLAATAELGGYAAGSWPLGALTADRSQNLLLHADRTACQASGYRAGPAGYREDFEAGDGGFTHTGTGDQWAWGGPQSWPGGCASGTGCWGTNLDGNYPANADMALVSPEILLPAAGSGAIALHWQQAWQLESAQYDAAYAEVSVAGEEWQTMWQHTGSTAETGWTGLHYDLTAAAGQRVRFRWRLVSDAAVEYAGLYIDDLAITAGCTAQAGGLVVGQVMVEDGTPLPGSTVRSGSETATARETPEDEALGEAFFSLFAPAGPQVLSASGTYGYGRATADVTIKQGEAVAVDFRLPAADSLRVEGRVKDARTGWPLYARIEIEGYPGGEVWSDPQSGLYSVELAAGLEYRLRTSAWMAGYQPAEVTLGPLAGSLVQDFDLEADPETCQAPGYARSGGLVETFDSGAMPAGWSVVNNRASEGWVFNDPKDRGNVTGGTGSFAIVDSDYAGRVEVDSELRTPAVDFSTAERVTLSFKSDFRQYSDEIAEVDISANGADGPWTNVWRQTGERRGPDGVTVDISGIAAGRSGVMARFHYSNANFEWWWQVDEVILGENPQCEPPGSGGLVVGSVLDANTLQPLPGSQVRAPAGQVMFTSPAGPLGAFYAFYLTSGDHTLEASGSERYGSASAAVAVPDGGAARLDLNLPAGRLETTPQALEATVEGSSPVAPLPLEIRNSGSRGAEFGIQVLPYEELEPGIFQTPDYVVKPFKQDYRPTAPADLPPVGMLPAALAAPALPDAAVSGSWEAGMAAWGVAYDAQQQQVWLSSPGAGWGGEDRLQAYLPDGTPQKGRFAHAMPHLYGPADLAYDPFNRQLWIMNVRSGQDNCIFAIDHQGGYTGEAICPGGDAGFAVSQRGLAYDPRTETWFTASWNDGSIYRFDARGNILAQVYTGLPASGLAYNPVSRRLFVLLSAETTRIIALDETRGFTPVGQLPLPEFSPYGGAGLEADAEGDLWAVDQLAGSVYRIATAEPALAALAAEVDWLVPGSPGGSLAAGEAQTVPFQVDGTSGGLQEPGVYQARVYLDHDTPYRVAPVPVTVTVQAPASYGLLEGVVSTLGYCDTHPNPLPGAVVTLSGPGGTKPVTSGSDGRYRVWMEAGAYTVKISHPEHVDFQPTNIDLVAGQTTVREPALRWDRPCVEVSPEVVRVVVIPGSMNHVSLLLSNLGAKGTSFSLDVDGDPPRWLSFAQGSGSLDPGSDVEVVITVDGEIWMEQSGIHPVQLLLMTDDPITPQRLIPLQIGFELPFWFYFPYVDNRGARGIP